MAPTPETIAQPSTPEPFSLFNQIRHHQKEVKWSMILNQLKRVEKTSWFYKHGDGFATVVWDMPHKYINAIKMNDWLPHIETFLKENGFPKSGEFVVQFSSLHLRYKVIEHKQTPMEL